MMNSPKFDCTFSSWYPIFRENSVEATIIPIPENIVEYLERENFVLPLEASIGSALKDAEWADGSPVTDEQMRIDNQPTFPEFSKKIQDALDKYNAVFVKSNWSSLMDASWVIPLKCQTLEEVYLFLKSSDNIVSDLNTVRHLRDLKYPLPFSLVLKKWQDINPRTEFRCFVADNELIGISQRDTSQYYMFGESEKYDILTDIKNLFAECIKGRFPQHSHSFDVVRHNKGNVKIIDFGVLDNSCVEGTLFTYEELQQRNVLEFRVIGEEIGIQPKPNLNFGIPIEIEEFLQSNNNCSILNVIRAGGNPVEDASD